jgi:hypothetical protein
MIEREIQDRNNTVWKCVQAFSGVSGDLAEKAKEIEGDRTKVTVVCTPSGGAQTVRLQLNEGWGKTIFPTISLQN